MNDAARSPHGTGPRRGEKRPPARQRWPLVLAGSLIAVVAVVGVAAGSLLPGADATSRLSAAAQVLPVGVDLASCAGPTQLLSGAAVGSDPEFSAGSSTTKTQLSAVVLSDDAGVLPTAGVDTLAATPRTLFTLATAPQESDEPQAAATLAPITGVAKEKAAVRHDQSVDAASVLRTLPLQGRNSRSAGAVVVAAADGDLRSLAAASCQRPANELWFNGAATTVGRTAVLNLSNATASSATVELELFGAAGRISAPGGKNLVVPPGGSKAVVLSGLAPNEKQLSVHVRSAGGAVSGLIQQSVLRGLTPGGVDFLAPVQAPATTATIPGVRLGDAGTAAAVTAQAGYADATTALQVTVPGGTDAVVEVEAHGPTGQVALPNGGVFTAAAGAVSELSLAGLPQGSYSLSLKADYAVTAAVRLSHATQAGEAVDLAVTPSTARLGVNHVLPLTNLAESTLALSAPTGAATVTLVPVSGAGELGTAQSVELKAGMSQDVALRQLLGQDTQAVILSAAGESVYGTQLLGSPDSANVAVLPIAATPAESPSLNITTGQ